MNQSLWKNYDHHWEDGVSIVQFLEETFRVWEVVKLRSWLVVFSSLAGDQERYIQLYESTNQSLDLNYQGLLGCNIYDDRHFFYWVVFWKVLSGRPLCQTFRVWEVVKLRSWPVVFPCLAGDQERYMQLYESTNQSIDLNYQGVLGHNILTSFTSKW